jgi:NADH-quinone oxidoreductase chain G
MTEQTVCLTIDGQKITCPSTWTVYEAATAAGIHIPTFCHHEKLTPVGASRMCLVEIEGARGLQTSCTTPVREGLVVRVHTSPAAVKARKANLEFLLTNHPLDCPVCDKGGECPLQNQTLLDGPGKSRYVEEKRHKDKRHPLGELIVLDQERCVLCWRCIRFLDEWGGDHELDLFGRGAAVRLDAFPGRPLKSKWQGNTIDICPVGALTSRVFRFEARVWELTNTASICPMCSVGCNILLGVKNGELCRITPRENGQVNDTWICDKGRFTHAWVDHADRLKTPLIRREGTLQPATWDEALDLIARRFGDTVQNEGPQTIAGLASTRVTNEANYLFQRFFRSVAGSNNVDHLGRLPEGATPLASLPDLENRDVFVLLGLDPSTEAPLVELWIKKAILRHGAQVIGAGPRRIELARYGGPWLGHRPGSEAALLNGLARAVLDAGPAATAARVANAEEFRSWLREWDAKRVEQATGVAVDALQRAGQILAQAKHPVILYGSNWLNGQPQGTAPTAAQTAVANLGLLLGGVEAAFIPEDNNTLGALEMGAVPGLFPGGQPVGEQKAHSRLAGFWGGKLSPVAGLSFAQMMTAACGGGVTPPLQAIWIMGSDPANEVRGASEALGRVPFVVVQDLFLTDTAELAEVVLPAAGFAEVGGTFYNMTGRLQALHAGKLPPGQARPDWWIITELAKRMVDSKRRRAWEFSGPEEVLDEIFKVLPSHRGASRASIGENGWQPPASQSVTRRAFVRVAGDPQPATTEQEEYPLLLVAGRELYDRGTLLQRATPAGKLAPEAYILVHPSDAGRLGLEEGDEASAVSATGRLAFSVKISDGVVPGVVYAPRNLSAAPLSVLGADPWAWPRVRIAK